MHVGVEPRFVAWPFRVALALVLTGLVLLFMRTPAYRAVEMRLYDLRVKQMARHVEPSPQVVLVAIDDASLARMEPTLGRWPWPRSAIATLVDRCAGARTVAIDIIFPEADLGDPGGDRALAEAVRRHGHVVSAAYLDDEARPPRDWSRWALRATPGLETANLLQRRSALLPYQALLEASQAVGFVNYLADEDGVVRLHHVAGTVDGTVVPSLPLAAVTDYLRAKGAQSRLQAGEVVVGAQAVPLDGQHAIRLLAGVAPHRTISAADLLVSDAGASPPALQDKLVVVGALATGLEGDRVVTPLSTYTPGVVMLATAADNLLTGRWIRVTWPAMAVGLVLLLGLAVAVPRFHHPKTITTAAVLIAVVYGWVVVLAAWAARLMLPVTGPLLALTLVATALGAIYWLAEYRQRRCLEQLEAARQEFTDMLVHDLRNQLAPVLMAMTALHDKLGGTSEFARTLLEGGAAGARRMSHLTSTLLDIRRMQEAGLNLRRATFEVRPLLEEVRKEFQAESTALGHDLVVAGSVGASMMMHADRDIVFRLLGNLVRNALHHAAEGSAVEMEAETTPSGRTVLRVSNAGPVLSQELVREILKPFVSGEGAVNREMRGTGLGLAFCELAAAAHDGKLGVVSPRRGYTDGVTVEVTL